MKAIRVKGGETVWSNNSETLLRPEHTRRTRPVEELQLTAIVDHEQIELQDAITSSLHANADAGGNPSPAGPEPEMLGDPQDVHRYLVGANKRPAAPPAAVRATTIVRSYGERTFFGTGPNFLV